MIRRGGSTPECRHGSNDLREHRGKRPATRIAGGYCEIYPVNPTTKAGRSEPIIAGGRAEGENVMPDEGVVVKGLEIIITRLFSSHRGQNFAVFKSQILARCDTGEPVVVGDNDTIDRAYLDLEPGDNCAIVIATVSPEARHYSAPEKPIYIPLISLEIPVAGPEGEMLFSPEAAANMREIESRFNT